MGFGCKGAGVVIGGDSMPADGDVVVAGEGEGAPESVGSGCRVSFEEVPGFEALLSPEVPGFEADFDESPSLDAELRVSFGDCCADFRDFFTTKDFRLPKFESD